jgi:rfaE bifunctional protein kinase chain/domain
VKLNRILSNKNILVIGDSILDRYIYGKVYRVSPEAPVPVVVKKNDSYFLGGAANVAQNITSFGSKCTLLTVAGNDQAHDDLKNLCKEKNIDCISIIDSSRPTTIKTRIIGNDHQIVRIDEEVTEKISFEIQSQIIELLNKIIHDFDAVILQDYGKGLLANELVSEIISMCNLNGKKTIIDPKDPDISKYSCCTLIKPNLSEFKTIAGVPLDKDISQKEIVKIEVTDTGESLNCAMLGDSINVLPMGFMQRKSVNTPKTIPIVVHVVYTDAIPGTYIDPETIPEAIEQLNEKLDINFIGIFFCSCQITIQQVYYRINQ